MVRSPDRSKSGMISRASAVAVALLYGAVAARTTAAAAPNQAVPFSLDAAAQEPRLVQTKLREAGVGGSFEEWGIRFGGHAEAGYLYNSNRPKLRQDVIAPSTIPEEPTSTDHNGFGQLFTDKSDSVYLNQFDAFVERVPLRSSNQFDLGFKVETLFGADARYTQANGSNFYSSDYAGLTKFRVVSGFGSGQHNAAAGPRNQIDVLQAYLTANLPVGDNGLLLTAGRFVTPWGMETIDPTHNSLYTHSYIFGLSTPRTLTGLTARYAIDDQWGVMGGVVVGWDQSLEDNNDFPSFVAQGTYQPDDRTSLVLSAIVGPEQTGNRSDFRWMLDFTADWKVSGDVHVGVESVLGYEDDAGNHRVFAGAGFPKFITSTGNDGYWLGVAGYYDQQIDSEGVWTFHARAEYFDDGSGMRALVGEVFEVTAGLAIRPFVNDAVGKNLVLRPEIRYDYSPQDFFDGFERKSQWLLGGDVTFAF